MLADSIREVVRVYNRELLGGVEIVRGEREGVADVAPIQFP